MKIKRIEKKLIGLMLVIILLAVSGGTGGDNFSDVKARPTGVDLEQGRETVAGTKGEQPYTIAIGAVIKGIFEVVGVVGDIAGAVFDTMNQMGVEQALGQLIEGGSQINSKLGKTKGFTLFVCQTYQFGNIYITCINTNKFVRNNSS